MEQSVARHLGRTAKDAGAAGWQLGSERQVGRNWWATLFDRRQYDEPGGLLPLPANLPIQRRMTGLAVRLALLGYGLRFKLRTSLEVGTNHAVLRQRARPREDLSSNQHPIAKNTPCRRW